MNFIKKVILLILFIVAILYSYSFFNKNKKVCSNPFEVKDFTSGKERVMICDKTLYKGSVKIVDNKEYPELYQFLLNKDSKPNEVKQYVCQVPVFSTTFSKTFCS